MKLAALAVALLLLAAQDKPEDSALVKAAKAAGGKRKSTSKVITNDDVKKRAAKPTTATTSKSAAKTTAPPPQVTDTTGPLAKQDERYHARIAAAKRAGDVEDRVAQLEAEVRRLELAYYAEGDLNYRDTAIVPRFNQVKKQLDTARKELADARDALSKLQ